MRRQRRAKIRKTGTALHRVSNPLHRWIWPGCTDMAQTGRKIAPLRRRAGRPCLWTLPCPALLLCALALKASGPDPHGWYPALWSRAGCARGPGMWLAFPDWDRQGSAERLRQGRRAAGNLGEGSAPACLGCLAAFGARQAAAALVALGKPHCQSAPPSHRAPGLSDAGAGTLKPPACRGPGSQGRRRPYLASLGAWGPLQGRRSSGTLACAGPGDQRRRRPHPAALPSPGAWGPPQSRRRSCGAPACRRPGGLRRRPRRAALLVPCAWGSPRGRRWSSGVAPVHRGWHWSSGGPRGRRPYGHRRQRLLLHYAGSPLARPARHGRGSSPLSGSHQRHPALRRRSWATT
mmetsp:Transcript_98854/g.300038  ORF Transcript_98854/g.300038 Transcript_98854/m.300038 type:complete len:348 (+) Transcript_98854:303-1346(+)